MVKEIKGPWGIILIGPAASNTPYKAWDRNQGTYLAIAAAAPLFLTLFATISLPIIPGVYTAKMTVGDKVGEAMFGLWGTCLKGQDINDTIVDNCTPWSMMGGNTTLLSVPANSWQIRLPSSPEDSIDHAIPNDLKWANLVFHAVAVTCAWLASTIALAASGEWHKQRQPAWDFLRWAWGMELISGMFSVIPWAMEIAFLMKIKGIEGYWTEQSKQTVKVTAGPTIFLLSAALAIHIALALVRLFWSKNEPRPTWTLEAAGDFHSAPPAGTGLHGDWRGSGLAPLAVPPYGAGMGGRGLGMPNSAGLPANDEKPPAWENLNLDSSIQVTDEKYWPPTELDDAVPITPAHVAAPQVQVQGAQAPGNARV